MSFMGFTEVVRHLPAIRRIWRGTIDLIASEKPDLVVLVDYPGFNLRLAAAVSRRGIRCVYYISPQLWAWHSSRVKQIRRFVDEVFCILPFEAEWYLERGVSARFVGHPLLDKYPRPSAVPEETGLPDAPVIGVFPGSRDQEFIRHLPVMIETLKSLHKKYPGLQARVAVAPGINCSYYQRCYPQSWLEWITENHWACMEPAALLLMCSGTATLEAALHLKPMVVIYRLSEFSYWLGRLFIQVPFISITNLIAAKAGVPELIQNDATPEALFRVTDHLLSDVNQRNEQRQFLLSVINQLGEPGASRRVAELIGHYFESEEE